MARKPLAAAKCKTQPKPTPKPVPASVDRPLEMTGVDRDFPLSKIRPNGWNPNKMSAFMLKSFEQELVDTGWLRSMKILVWGKDEKGVERNIIIDGEHRWKIGRKLGYSTVPMVFMDGLTEAQAKRLTIRIRKQGEYDAEDLSRLLQEPEVRGDLDFDTYSLSMGFETSEMSKLLDIDMNLTDKTDVGEHERTLPKTGMSGVQPNIRIPMVFYADTVPEADEIRAVFSHPRREHELDGTLLLKTIHLMLESHKDKIEQWRKEAAQAAKASK